MQTAIKKLGNGITVIAGSRPDSNVCAVAVDVLAGSMHETEPDQWGVAHFLEHMGFKGTNSRSRLDIAREIEGRGGQVNAATYHDRTQYYIVTQGRHLGHAAEVLHDVLFHSVYPKDEFEKERKVVLEEIKQTEDSWVNIIWRHFDQIMFEGGTRAHPVVGAFAPVEIITREELLAFAAQHYQPHNMTVAAVGPGAPEEMLWLLERQFDRATGREREKPLQGQAAALVANAFGMVSTKFDQCYQFVGMPGFTDAELARRPEARIATTLVGDGMSSKLFQRVREKLGLAYMTGAFLDSTLHNGTFVAYSVVDPANADAAHEATLAVLEEVASDKIAEDELQEAKERVVGGMYIGCERALNIACRMIYDVTAVGTVRLLKEREEGYRKVTVKQVAACMAELLERPKLWLRLVPFGTETKVEAKEEA